MWEDKLAVYDAIVAKCPDFKRKGKSVPCTTANGHMFSVLNKEGELGFRYGKEQQEAYLKKYNTTIFKSHNAVMRGYILITDEMQKDLDLCAKLLNESHTYVLSLDPPKKK